MHKKSIIFICCLIFLILFGISSIYDEPEVISSGISKSVMNSNTLTMMYETDYQSGEYQVSSDTTWPESGYTFNESLSKCENGSKLTWDDENKTVLVQANVSDK